MGGSVGVLLPEREVKLLNGERVVIKPWGIRLGKRMLDRLGDLIEILKSKPETKASELLDVAFDEIMEISRETVGMSPEEWEEKVTFEDGVRVATDVINVCLFREDGEGPLLALTDLAIGVARVLTPLRSLRQGAGDESVSSSVNGSPKTTSESPSNSSSARATG